MVDFTGYRSVVQVGCIDTAVLNALPDSMQGHSFCVDSSSAAVDSAIAAGHQAMTGNWETLNLYDYNSFPSPDKISALVLLQGLVSSPDPVAFLRSASRAMGHDTKLYATLPHCSAMWTESKSSLPPLYHSIFSNRSLSMAARGAGLRVVSLAHPQHCETSDAMCMSTCVVVMERDAMSEGDRPAGPTQAAERVVTMRLSARAKQTKLWVQRHILALQQNGFSVVAIGSQQQVAQSRLVLNFLSAPMDPADGCLGSPVAASIDLPVTDIEALLMSDGCEVSAESCSVEELLLAATHDGIAADNPVAILVLLEDVWASLINFMKVTSVRSYAGVVCILPYVDPKVVKFPFQTMPGEYTVLTTFPPNLLPLSISSSQLIANTKPRKIILISHFYNEELLLPYWVRHHARYFDEAVLIDYQSTDRSAEIIRELAPSGWRVVSSRNKIFDAVPCDEEVMWYERLYPDEWKVALTTTEFLLSKDIRGTLRSYEEQWRTIQTAGAPFKRILTLRSAVMTGDDSEPLIEHHNLIAQRSVYRIHAAKHIGFTKALGTNDKIPTSYSRFIHAGLTQNEFTYAAGRHDVMYLPPGHRNDEYCADAMVLKFMFTPWPQVIDRKIQIGPRMGHDESFQHRYTSENRENAINLRDIVLNKSVEFDLRSAFIMPDLKEWRELHRVYAESFVEVPVDYNINRDLNPM
jgi:hypothetical protein